MMYFFPLISIVVLYFLVAATKPYLQPKMPFKVCAICVAVSLTWFILLGLWLFGYEVSPLFVGVLMGMSITGFMYRLEDVYKRHKVRNFWLVRVVVIVGYFYSVIEFLEGRGDVLLFVAILSVIVIAIASLFFQGTTHADSPGMRKRLDDCC